MGDVLIGQLTTNIYLCVYKLIDEKLYTIEELCAGIKPSSPCAIYITNQYEVDCWYEVQANQSFKILTNQVDIKSALEELYQDKVD